MYSSFPPLLTLPILEKRIPHGKLLRKRCWYTTVPLMYTKIPKLLAFGELHALPPPLPLPFPSSWSRSSKEVYPTVSFPRIRLFRKIVCTSEERKTGIQSELQAIYRGLERDTWLYSSSSPIQCSFLIMGLSIERSKGQLNCVTIHPISSNIHRVVLCHDSCLLWKITLEASSY